MKKWIITGGAGFIGSHCAATLIQQGNKVVVLDDLSRKGAQLNLEWLKERGLETFIHVDVREKDAVLDAISKHADANALLHLAAQVAVTWSVEEPRTDFEINALGTFNVLEGIRQGGNPDMALLYSSTNKVYGDLNHFNYVEEDSRFTLPERPMGIGENEPLDFHSPYGCSKGTGDQYVRDYSRIYDLKTVVFRQSCIYGTRQFGVEDQGWIAWFCIACLLGRPITVYGNGKQVRDALWITDLIDLYERAVEQIDKVSGEVFNIGGGPENTLSLLELIDKISARMDKEINPAFSDVRPGDQKIFIADIRKAEKLLGWKPAVSPDAGIDQLYGWIQDNIELFN